MRLSIEALTGCRRHLMWIAYDGSRFPEMASGNTGFAIMDLLKSAAAQILGVPSVLAAPSSRTDSGVHALRNAVLIQVGTDVLPDEAARGSFQSKMNALLDATTQSSLKLLRLHPVSDGFGTRRHVAYRRYTYRIAVPQREENVSVPVMFSERSYSWILQRSHFDHQRAIAACSILRGNYNWASFFKHPLNQRNHAKDYQSTIRLINVWLSTGEPYAISNDLYEYFDINVVARSFLREQVRRMVAVIVAYACGRIRMDQIKWLLNNPDPMNFYAVVHRPAPSGGLFLTDIAYPEPAFANPVPYVIQGWDLDDPPMEKNKKDNEPTPDILNSDYQAS